MLHVTFTPSGAGILRQALRQQLGPAARGSRVIVLDDPLCLGPIDPPDSERRLGWMIEYLGVSASDWDWLPEYVARFWDEALSVDDPIVWTSRRSAAEYCGFLEWTARRGDALYRLVDVTGSTFLGRSGQALPLISISQVHPDLLDIQALLASAHSPTMEERRATKHCWEALKAEGANLRVIDDGRVVSAPDGYFDSLILAEASDRWVKAMLVVGMAMANSDPTTIPTHHLYFEGRLRKLVRLGVLEARGDLNDLRRTEVRSAVVKSDSY